MIKTKYMFLEAKAKDTTSEAKAKDLAPKAKDMTSCLRGASRPRPWPRGLHLCHLLLPRLCVVSYVALLLY